MISTKTNSLLELAQFWSQRLSPDFSLRDHEKYLYTPLDAISFGISPKEPWHRALGDVVFHNGYLAQGDVLGMEDAPAFLQEKYLSLRQKEDDFLCRYNLAYSPAFYYLPLRQNNSKITIADSERRHAVATSLLCYIPPGAEHYLEIHNMAQETRLSHCHIVVFLASGSKLQLLLIHELDEPSQSIVHLHFILSVESQAVVYDLQLSGKLSRTSIEADLEGERSFFSLNGLLLGRGEEHRDSTSLLIHRSSYSESKTLCLSLLNNKASSAITGNIVVEPRIREAKAHQLLRSLLLSDDAKAFCRPQLEIGSHEVNCSHGSSIGELDQEALYYLQSRGVSKEEARQLLLKAATAHLLQDLAPIFLPTTQERLNYYLKEVAYG
ncbi:MAG: SufD family Fe-S cluster assembly protein [Leptospiraceae bacterium]|nr:SufD family Fe-S cluster assembly protein [Leptospiraceae bacterium]MDW8306454.1 SufD family Fe-S cluster assembly protein [Leptospiraceae bacterium]